MVGHLKVVSVVSIQSVVQKKKKVLWVGNGFSHVAIEICKDLHTSEYGPVGCVYEFKTPLFLLSKRVCVCVCACVFTCVRVCVLMVNSLMYEMYHDKRDVFLCFF